MTPTRQHLAEKYRELLADIYAGCAAAPSAAPLPQELYIQGLWASHQHPTEAATLHHGTVRILEGGRWNRCPGPDFTHAEIELNGKRIRGDIEIDPCAQDWERHGHGANPNFNNVVLHIVLTPPPSGWFTRNSLHQEIPLLYLPPETWEPDNPRIQYGDPPLPRCRQPLADMSTEKIILLLQAAAAQRMANKRSRLHQRINAVGERQTWYEAWGTTLGYSANKTPMHMLTLRAPLKDILHEPEAKLLGTAGFLVPLLQDSATPEARNYHRSVWDAWWLVREQFEISRERALPWCQAPTRPINHPQRRVAALAASVAQWSRIMPLLSTRTAGELEKRLGAITHPFWDTHYTLTSAPMKQKSALIGQSRITDFLVNHLFPYDDTPQSWEQYLRIRQSSIPHGVERTAGLLFGERNELKSHLRYAYVQQALLQIDSDFCASNICQDCAFPAQLCQWH